MDENLRETSSEITLGSRLYQLEKINAFSFVLSRVWNKETGVLHHEESSIRYLHLEA